MLQTTVTSNIDEWKKQGYKAASYLTSAQMAGDLTNTLTPRYRTLIREQFDREGRGATGRWTPLSANYAKWKRKSYPGRKILELTGAMKQSFTTPSRNIAYGVIQGSSYVFRFGSEDEKAEWHQSGAGNLPVRKIIDFNTQQLRGIGLSIARTLEDGLFTRVFFDRKQTGTYRFTGFDRIDL